MKNARSILIKEIISAAENEFYSKHRIYRMYGKRVFDFIFSAVGIVFLSPLFLILAGCVYACDRGPAIYRQQRIGKNARPFFIYKFRSMVVNADKIGSLSTSSNDERITPIGRFLRKTSLDEILQLFNVLLGDMSFVGYRPGVSALIDWGDKNYIKLLCMRPGITGFAQVFGRSSNSAEAVKKKNLKYFDEACFLTDLKLIFLTFICLFSKRSEVN